MSFLSGPYFWSFGPIDHTTGTQPLGVVEDAPTFRMAREADPITGDNLGAAIQGIVDRGGNLFIDMILQELDADAVLRAWWPYDPAAAVAPASNAGVPVQLGRIGITGTGAGTGRQIGRLTPTFELRGDKILNPGDLPTTDRFMTLLRFQAAAIAPGFDVTQLLGSRLRNVPMSFLCQLFLDGTDTVFWNTTAVPP